MTPRRSILYERIALGFGAALFVTGITLCSVGIMIAGVPLLVTGIVVVGMAYMEISCKRR